MEKFWGGIQQNKIDMVGFRIHGLGVVFFDDKYEEHFK